MATAATETKECSICIDTFNRSTRKPIQCPYCAISICRACAQRCILLTPQPECPQPECKKPWSSDFLLDSFTRVWMYGDYRTHCEKYALDLERARLPETQEDGKRYQEAKKLMENFNTHIEIYKKQIDSLPETHARKVLDEKLTEIRNKYRILCVKNKWNYYYLQSTATAEQRKEQEKVKKVEENIEEIRKAHNKAAHPYKSKISSITGKADYIKAFHEKDTFGREYRVAVGGAGTSTIEPVKKSWTFTMKCPAGTCEGFVGLDWVCGLCSEKVCQHCREVKTAREEDKHECDPEKRENVKALVKEAKPCPKCASQISKVDGCDQMWCTQCHTAFSWRTGAIEDHVHNPHYYEWMRRNGQAIPAPGQARIVVGECMTPRQTINNAEMYLRNKPEIFRWIQPVNHIIAFAQYQLAYRGRSETGYEEERRKLRVKRLTGEIADKEWGAKLELINIQKRRNSDARDILNMFIEAGCDILRQAMLEITDAKEKAKHMADLAEYTNGQIQKHNSKYRDTLEMIVLR